MSHAFDHHPLAAGAYTLPDAARLLHLPAARLRSWISASPSQGSPRKAGAMASRGEARDKHIDFYTLIELFTIAELRRLGVSMKTLRQCREELAKRYNTPYPFALRGLLTDGRKLLRELGDAALLELGSGGQSAFEVLVSPFCKRLEFDAASQLASRFFPMGKDVPIEVSPHHAFGRPVITGTNLATETIASLLRGGESVENIASDFELPPSVVEQAWRFEGRQAA